MYLSQKCPSCKTVTEFVYVQIGHRTNCKKCNYEFKLVTKQPRFLPQFIWIGVILAIGAVGYYLIKTFHDWWIYRAH